MSTKAMVNTQAVRQGEIVDYVLPTGRNAGQHRPAIVVRIWETPLTRQLKAVQLQVFIDGSNDFEHGQPGTLGGLLWATSVLQDEERKQPGSWHWPEVEE
ncbi:MAG TPA: hypothetical protein VGD98_23255 [Ktedonobacteraceae bacterium]